MFELYSYFFDVLALEQQEQYKLIPPKRLADYKSMFSPFPIVKNDHLGDLFGDLVSYSTSRYGSSVIQLLDSITTTDLMKSSSINQTWIRNPIHFASIFDMYSPSRSWFIANPVYVEAQARVFCPAHKILHRVGGLSIVCSKHREECLKYCQLKDHLAMHKNEILRTLRRSVEQVSSDGTVDILPICKTGNEDASSSCWTQIITNKGICYSTYSGKRLKSQIKEGSTMKLVTFKDKPTIISGTGVDTNRYFVMKTGRFTGPPTGKQRYSRLRSNILS